MLFVALIPVGTRLSVITLQLKPVAGVAIVNDRSIAPAILDPVMSHRIPIAVAKEFPEPQNLRRTGDSNVGLEGPVLLLRPNVRNRIRFVAWLRATRVAASPNYHHPHFAALCTKRGPVLLRNFCKFTAHYIIWRF